MLALLALVPIVSVLVGCSSVGSGGSSSQTSAEDQRASQAAGSSMGSKSAEDSDEGRASTAKLGHPALGSAEAPVVLTEYADYQ